VRANVSIGLVCIRSGSPETQSSRRLARLQTRQRQSHAVPVVIGSAYLQSASHLRNALQPFSVQMVVTLSSAPLLGNEINGMSCLRQFKYSSESRPSRKMPPSILSPAVKSVEARGGCVRLEASASACEFAAQKSTRFSPRNAPDLRMALKIRATSIAVCVIHSAIDWRLVALCSMWRAAGGH